MTGIDENSILNSIYLTNSLAEKGFSSNKVEDYQSQNTSYKVLKTILSFHHYVNRKVWFK